MDEKDILKRLVKNDKLFRKIHVVTQRYDILPNDKDHMGAFIDYQDISELRDDFVEELSDTIVDWIYSSEKFTELKNKLISQGKSEAAATREIGRLTQEKFRANRNDEDLLIQGQLGELLLFQFVQRYMKAVPLLRKMSITTSAGHERFGADAIHYKIENGKHIIVLGEAKTYTSKYRFNKAFEEALDSILNSYNNLRKELRLYVHEDFLDDELNVVAEEYLNNTLEDVEVHLVSLITYNETHKLNVSNETDIKKQIKDVIENKYKNFENSKINLNKNPILNRITYIVFPVWDLEDLARKFQKLI